VLLATRVRADSADVLRREELPEGVQAKGVSLFRHWESLVLPPGGSVEWPLWLHPSPAAANAGVLEVQMLWACEPDGAQLVSGTCGGSMRSAVSVVTLVSRLSEPDLSTLRSPLTVCMQ